MCSKRVTSDKGDIWRSVSSLSVTVCCWEIFSEMVGCEEIPYSPQGQPGHFRAVSHSTHTFFFSGMLKVMHTNMMSQGFACPSPRRTPFGSSPLQMFTSHHLPLPRSVQAIWKLSSPANMLIEGKEAEGAQRYILIITSVRAQTGEHDRIKKEMRCRSISAFCKWMGIRWQVKWWRA